MTGHDNAVISRKAKVPPRFFLLLALLVAAQAIFYIFFGNVWESPPAPAPGYYMLSKEEELDARSTRFPSVEARVKFAMSNWYVPPCADSDGAVILYQLLSWNQTSQRRSYVLREISVMGEQSNSSQSMDTTSAPLIEVESSIKGDITFLIDRESLYQQKEERKSGLPLAGYAKDVFQTILPLFDNLNGAPLLTQWGDAPGSRVLLFNQTDAPPTFISYPALPIIKKFRAVVSRDELDRVTSADCYGANRPQSGPNKFPSIIWQLKAGRHFGPLKLVERNDIPWEQKLNQAVFRGGPNGIISDSFRRAETERDRCLAMARCRLILLSGNSTLLDTRMKRIDKRVGMNSTIDGVELVGKELSMKDQLRYKAIIMIQGNDVATGLKWALMSNSVLMIPPPTVTTWAMEELLEPWVHYIPLDASLGDAEEKMQWVVDHDREAQEIAHRGGLWMKDMVFHPDAAKDDQAVYKEILRRYQSHFRASDKLV
jgi:hypothetical protein